MIKTHYIGTLVSLESGAFTMILDRDRHETFIVNYDSSILQFALEPRMHIAVETNGIVAMSYPPRIYAQNIIKYDDLRRFQAKVLEVTEVLLVRCLDEDSPYFNQDICVHLNPELQHTTYTVDSDVEILFNGMMTRSLPPQIQAIECTLIETT